MQQHVGRDKHIRAVQLASKKKSTQRLLQQSVGLSAKVNKWSDFHRPYHIVATASNMKTWSSFATSLIRLHGELLKHNPVTIGVYSLCHKLVSITQRPYHDIVPTASNKARLRAHSYFIFIITTYYIILHNRA
jgi:hypothetical protein